MKWGLLSLLSLVTGVVMAGPRSVCRIQQYDDHSGLSQWRVTGVAKDPQGMMWFTTWNGLNRFDGYEFEVFKSMPGDTCDMSCDRQTAICLSPAGDSLYVLVDDQIPYGFDLRTYTYGRISMKQFNRQREQKGLTFINFDTKYNHYAYIDHTGTRWTIYRDGTMRYWDTQLRQWTDYPTGKEGTMEVNKLWADQEDNLWAIGRYGFYKIEIYRNPCEIFPQEQSALIRAFLVDNHSRYWVSSREDKTVRVYSERNELLGYLAPNGTLHKNYTQFGASVYCFKQTLDGDIWMGCKPEGLFRLRETEKNTFAVTNFQKDSKQRFSLNCNDIFDIQQDARKRLWIATFDGGLNMVPDLKEDPLHFLHGNNGMRLSKGLDKARIHRICVTHDQKLLAATTDGLIIGDASEALATRMEFTIHRREPGRESSLSNSACMDVMETSTYEVLVATESGGINCIPTDSLLAPELKFRHYDTRIGMPTDVTLSVFEDKPGNVWIVSNNQLLELDLQTGHGHNYDAVFWQSKFHFSDAHPVRLPDGRYIFGLQDGAFTCRLENLKKRAFEPPIAFTSLSIQSGDLIRNVNHLDSLILNEDQRSLTLNFAALDYKETEQVNYEYKLVSSQDSGLWIHLNHNHTVTLLDLRPGKYTLCIRSTNSEDVWANNERQLYIEVIPRFEETSEAQVIIAGVLIGVVLLIVFLVFMYYMMRRRQHELYERYMDAIAAKQKRRQTGDVSAASNMIDVISHNDEDDAFMARVMRFTADRMDDPDATVDEMAAAAAKSLSGLNRKMKSLLGVTPADFLRNARLQHALDLLQNNEDLPVQEVARMCGFSDAKYFGRCFRSKYGQSPSSYKQKKK